MNHLKINFRTKVIGGNKIKFIKGFKKSHCDMPKMRCSKLFGGVANSHLFEKALHRKLKSFNVPFGQEVELDELNQIIKPGIMFAWYFENDLFLNFTIFMDDSK